MTFIRTQGGKPVMRDGKVGTGQGCCCGCCECACPGGFQVRVNGVVINSGECEAYGPESWKYPYYEALTPLTPIGKVTCGPPIGYLNGCDEIFYPNGDAPGYDQYLNPNLEIDWSSFDGSARYCLKCENNRLILAIGIYTVIPNNLEGAWSFYDAFYEVRGTCPEALSVTLTEPIIGGELVYPGEPPFMLQGAVRNGIIYRTGDFSDGAFGVCFRPAEFDPSQLTVEIECNPAGVCRFEDPQFPPYLPCLGWAGSKYGWESITQQDACEFEGGTWHPDERCEDNPCADNPFP